MLTGGADLPPHLADPEDRVDGNVAAHRVDRPDADVLADPVGVGDAAGVDEIVDQHRGDDLTAQLMRPDVAAELVTQLDREIPGQPGRERFLVGQLTAQQLGLEGQLDVGHQRGEFGRGQADPGFGSPPDLLLRWERLELAVESVLLDEVLDHARVHRQQAGRVHAAGAHQVVLVLVVSEHELTDLIGH